MFRGKIDRLLNKFGYYHTGLDGLKTITDKDVNELFLLYKDNGTMLSLLKELSLRDKELYFQAATDSDRDKIRGAFMRNHYFISLIKKADGKRK